MKLIMRILSKLEGAHIDFDYGEEQMLAEKWSIGRDEKGRSVLTIGEASYHTVLVSGMLTNQKHYAERTPPLCCRGRKGPVY